MSSMARPWLEKRVMSSGDRRPGTCPAMICPSSCTASCITAPVSSAWSRFPASRPSSSRESTVTRLARFTTSRSISRLNRKLDPAAFTWAPGLSHSPRSTGSADDAIAPPVACARAREGGAGGVRVGAGLEPLAPQHRLRGRSHRHHDVLRRRLLGSRGGVYLHSQPLAHLFGECLARLLGTAGGA